jgi:hypothetical protein
MRSSCRHRGRISQRDATPAHHQAFTPGGSNDVVAREIATGLQTAQPAAVARTSPGRRQYRYSFVAKSPPDGHISADRAGLVHQW